jgi:gamma-glutamyltranspeptidase/glutathione hydrolase
LLHSERGRAQFGRLDAAGKVHLMQEGDRYLCPGVADLLEAMAKEGWKKVYNGPFRQQMLTSAGLKAGGLLSERDFEAYEVYYRSPLTFAYRGASVHTTPPPGAGGEMIALMLALLETESLESFGSIEHRALLGRMMKVAEEARLAEAVTTQSYPRWKKRFAELAGKPLGSVEALPSGAGSTTHVTVLDGEGNACAVTFSYGEGNGYLIGDTNIMMNNLMGEEDLFPNGFFSWIPGERLSTMMSPTLVEAPDGALFVLGTGGANRIRTAITQAVSNLLDFEMDVHRATLAPRVHFEGGVFNAEVFESRASDKFDTLGPQEIVRFVEPNLFFGGVHLCCRKADGALDAAGDPRRGGAVAAV